MRAQLLLVILVSACTPEITSDTYSCGPEMLCPPKLACHLGPLQSDDSLESARFAYSCVTTLIAGPFACSDVTSDQEPDDEPSAGLDLTALACGSQFEFTDWGCIAQSDDVDHYRFSIPTACLGNDPRFQANLRYPIGTAPLTLDLLDASGTVISSAELCSNSSTEGGIEASCLIVPNLPVGDYVLRVKLDPVGTADCDGECAFNRYQLRLSSLVS